MATASNAQNIMEGIMRYARQEIEVRIRNEAEKITAQVVLETMNKLRIEMHDPVDRLRTELVFRFEKEKGE
jgi:RNase P/RNase MRP subunit p29